MDTPDLEKEVRFALVMYGGVSLAVYINGVAQEFYSLVRATSSASLGGAGTCGTEAVYRKLGAILGATGADLSAANGPIRTRFVVDILSGTSAGGLNSVFLAKALAKGLDFGVMEKLWVDEADIATLMNDGDSLAPIAGGFTMCAQKPPQSLLNSERMYALLLSALREMDSTPVESEPGREVDLFVTATDLRGLEVRLKLADSVVTEKRHRNVFHFCASPYLPPPIPSEPGSVEPTKRMRNDFEAGYNSFLAFAGRCTAAFPIAFEPMRLGDIDAVLDRCTELKNEATVRSTSPDWRPFIEEYLPEDDDSPRANDQIPKRFRNRAFADGGYLNNKPFSYAIEELGVRGGDLPYDRKLVYIEPSPETVEEKGSDAAKPDAIENAFDAAFVLPRYQTIREDLRRVVERNRLVTRISDVIEQLEETVDQSDLVLAFKSESAEEFGKKTLKELGDNRGPLYAGYHRLKIKTVTDDLRSMIGAALDLDEASDEMHALYFVVRAWVQANYDQAAKDGKKAESLFLLHFDLSYRERRLYFLLSRLDSLYGGEGDKKGESIKKSTNIDALFTGIGEEQARDWKDSIRRLRGSRDPRSMGLPKQCPSHRDQCPVRGHGLVAVSGYLRRQRNELRRRGQQNPLSAAAPARDQWREWLGGLLRGTDDEAAGAAKKLFDDQPPGNGLALRKQLNDMLQIVDRELKATFICAAGRIEELLGKENKPETFDARVVLRYCMRRQYDCYDFYDAISFPILYGTDTGTLKVTAVHRISPRDAISLVNEAEDSGNRTKLAGDSLSAFGAFFQRSWRQNDLMWGRLDGAERIINMLLPGEGAATIECRNQLLREAQKAILAKCLHAGDMQELIKAVADTVAGAPDGEPVNALAKAALDQSGSEARIRAFAQPEALVEYVRKSYLIDKTYQPEWTLPIAARAAKVTGQLLEFLGGERKWSAGPLLWVVRVTRLFWSVVEVAIPQSISYASFRYLVGIYGLAAALVVLTGFLLGQPALRMAGWKMAGAGAVVWVAVQLFHEAMSGRDAVWRALRLLLLAMLAALTVGGLTFGVSDAPYWIRYVRGQVMGMGVSAADLLCALGIAAGATMLSGLLTSLPGFSKRSRSAAARTPFAKPVLTMELARTPEEVQGVVATKGDRHSMRMVQYLDFALIASYGWFFVVAAWYEVRAWAAPWWMAAAAGLAGLAAAVFDVRENGSILRTLEREVKAIALERVQKTRQYALRKWALLGLGELLLGVGALQVAGPVAMAFGAVLCVAGIAGVLGCKWPTLLRVSMAGFALVVLACLVLALSM